MKIFLADSIENLQVAIKIIKVSSFLYHTSNDAFACFINLS